MNATQQLGPFCQSCSLPLQRPEDFGTEASGFRQNDYCHYCYANGAFTTPTATMQEVLDISVDMMAKQGIMAAPAARQMLTPIFPMLKRWQ
jgi:hypothetical protein